MQHCDELNKKKYAGKIQKIYTFLRKKMKSEREGRKESSFLQEGSWLEGDRNYREG